MAKFAVACGVMLVLSACSGGSGGAGISSTPPPAAPTPTPTNTSITDLRASQSFTNDATSTDVSFNLTSRSTISGRASSVPMTVRYDAANRSYAISGGGISTTFTEADKQAGTGAGETRYFRGGDTDTTYLTLVTTPYLGTASNRYVGMGYAQRNVRNGERQDTSFATFTYGLDTPAGGVPRAGSGTFATDAFGLASIPGSEPQVFQGRGRFDVDFVNGQFSTQTYVTRTGLISGQSVVGGGLDLTGGGRLSSSDGSFSGTMTFANSGRSISGPLNGRFFGPGAEEIGASFSGSASDGSAFNGALTGQRDTTLSPVNISFARLVTQQLFYADSTTLTVRKWRATGVASISDYPGQLGTSVSRSQFTDKTSGNVSYGTPTSNLAGGEYTVTSIVPGPTNFTSYERTINGQQTRLELYKTGADNRELALTYASFGRYSTAIDSDPLQTEVDRVFFVYGFGTPTGALDNRTGTASYSGVAYGAAANAAGTLFDVKGTSSMTLDFGSRALTGNLALTGSNGGGSIDYGAFGFSGTLFPYGSAATANISRGGGAAIGSMLINFYGPSAEEAGGIFRIRVPDGTGVSTLINGAMLARKQ